MEFAKFHYAIQLENQLVSWSANLALTKTAGSHLLQTLNLSCATSSCSTATHVPSTATHTPITYITTNDLSLAQLTFAHTLQTFHYADLLVHINIM